MKLFRKAADLRRRHQSEMAALDHETVRFRKKAERNHPQFLRLRLQCLINMLAHAVEDHAPYPAVRPETQKALKGRKRGKALSPRVHNQNDRSIQCFRYPVGGSLVSRGAEPVVIAHHAFDDGNFRAGGIFQEKPTQGMRV